MAKNIDPLAIIIAVIAAIAIAVAIMVVFGLMPALVELNAYMALG